MEEMGWADLFDKVVGPGDLGTILLASTAGYMLDAGFNIVGFLEPGILGLTFASSALGLKKMIEAMLQNDTKSYEKQLLTKAKKLISLFEKYHRTDLVKYLSKEIEIFNIDSSNIEDFEKVIDSCEKQFTASDKIDEVIKRAEKYISYFREKNYPQLAESIDAELEIFNIDSTIGPQRLEQVMKTSCDQFTMAKSKSIPMAQDD